MKIHDIARLRSLANNYMELVQTQSTNEIINGWRNLNDNISGRWVPEMPALSHGESSMVLIYGASAE
jgi:hypothetical protein